ncbi:MAG: hypothetical protein ABI883_02480 [Chthoniobacterales bacterium]
MISDTFSAASPSHANGFVGVLTGNPLKEKGHARFVAQAFARVVDLGEFHVAEEHVDLAMTRPANPNPGRGFALLEPRTRLQMMLG